MTPTASQELATINRLAPPVSYPGLLSHPVYLGALPFIAHISKGSRVVGITARCSGVYLFVCMPECIPCCVLRKHGSVGFYFPPWGMGWKLRVRAWGWGWGWAGDEESAGRVISQNILMGSLSTHEEDVVPGQLIVQHVTLPTPTDACCEKRGPVHAVV